MDWLESDRLLTRSGKPCRVSGVYESVCHGGTRTVLEGEKFPRCGYCNSDTAWTFKRPSKKNINIRQDSS
jgi:hypothetical protein